MKIFISTLLFTLLIASAPGSLWAHGGGHKAEPKKEEATLPELPKSTIGMETNTSGAVDYGMNDSMDAFGTEEVEGGGPLWGEEPQPAMSGHEGHDMSQMNVEPAEHEWIPTSQKGYGWAAALTLFSGLLFGFLTFKRPCE